MEEIEVLVNGLSRRVPAGSSVADLLEALSLRREGVAVAIDLRVIPRGQHGSRRLQAGERVEVITAVGGG